MKLGSILLLLNNDFIKLLFMIIFIGFIRFTSLELRDLLHKKCGDNF